MLFARRRLFPAIITPQGRYAVWVHYIIYTELAHRPPGERIIIIIIIIIPTESVAAAEYNITRPHFIIILLLFVGPFRIPIRNNIMYRRRRRNPLGPFIVVYNNNNNNNNTSALYTGIIILLKPVQDVAVRIESISLYYYYYYCMHIRDGHWNAGDEEA